MEAETPKKPNFLLVAQIIELISELDEGERLHVWNTVGTWLRLPTSSAPATSQPSSHLTTPQPTVADAHSRDFSFSEREESSPKNFLNEKLPTTDVERVACLAYYLTHYRECPDFKTADITKLNTEAAQRKLSNPAETTKNALKSNYLTVSAKKGHRQLSAMGEQYINALPDRDEANSIRKRMAPRKARTSKSQPKLSS